VVYIIENNQYAMGTAIDRSSAETRLFRRGASFRIPGEEVDGMDVLAVEAAARKAADHARAGKGPYILEMKTYRYRGHSMSDPAKYRSRDEVQAVREKSDPIDHAARELEKMGVGEAALKDIDKEIRRIVGEAADFAESSPEPAPDELYTDVLVETY
jgi:pyruvate dehydrogenase E1 component alpha subunit